MNINRHNYEEFFLLYLDNELCSEDRCRVELFVQENPDLRQELDILLQSRLIPDEAVIFQNKKELMKDEDSLFINLDNYSEWLLLYTDNELSASQKLAVVNFVSQHPVVKKELDILLQTKLQAEENIVFPNKELLYRTATIDDKERKPIIAIKWWRVAVAAALFLALGSTAFWMFNKKPENSTTIAAGDKHPAKPATNPIIKQPVNKPIQPGVANNGNDQKNETIKANEEAVVVKKSPALIKDIQREQEENVLAETNKNKLPQPTNNPNVDPKTEQNNPIAKMDLPELPSLTNPKQIKSIPVVTLANPQPLDIRTASMTAENDVIDASQSAKKNKLRGVFRKITRTFEKTTNINATNEDNRLLLGGLAIQL